MKHQWTIALLLAALTAPVAVAQQTGGITGVITDPAGATIGLPVISPPKGWLPVLMVLTTIWDGISTAAP